MSFDAYRVVGPLSFVPRLESRKKADSWRYIEDLTTFQVEHARGEPHGPGTGQLIEPLDAVLELPTKRSTVHAMPHRIRVRYRVHFKNGSLRDHSRSWSLDNLQEWQPSMPNPGAANPEVRIAPMTPDEEQRLLVAIDEAMAKHGSHLAGFGGTMHWNDFNKWLEQNGFKYTKGNVHWLGRGWWYPTPPSVEHDAEALDVVPPWVHIEKEQGNSNVFVNSSIGGKTDSTFCETPECARAAAEAALMALFLQLDRDTEDFSGYGAYIPPPDKRLPRDEPGWEGEYLPRVIHGEPDAYKKQQAWRKELDARPTPPPRQGTGPEYKGEALKLRGVDEGVSSQCDVGHHARCRGCECSCHARKGLGSLIGERWDNEIVQCTKCSRQHGPRQWQELPLIGTQPVEADEEGPAYTLEMRNCPCGSTLAVDLR